MERNQYPESDWKLLRQKLPGWQEAYMERLIGEYRVLLDGPEASSKKFWALEKRINDDKKNVGVRARMSRSELQGIIISLLDEGAITLSDLDEFSEALKEAARVWYHH